MTMALMLPVPPSHRSLPWWDRRLREAKETVSVVEYYHAKVCSACGHLCKVELQRSAEQPFARWMTVTLATVPSPLSASGHGHGWEGIRDPR